MQCHCVPFRLNCLPFNLTKYLLPLIIIVIIISLLSLSLSFLLAKRGWAAASTNNIQCWKFNVHKLLCIHRLSWNHIPFGYKHLTRPQVNVYWLEVIKFQSIYMTFCSNNNGRLWFTANGMSSMSAQRWS